MSENKNLDKDKNVHKVGDVSNETTRQETASQKVNNDITNNDNEQNHDSFRSVDDDEDLDEEVRRCLAGGSGYKSDLESSCTSSCSFYSSHTLPGDASEVDTMSSYSFYSTGTLKDTDTDTASYCSADTIKGDTDREEEADDDINTQTLQRSNTLVEFRNGWHSMEVVPDLPNDTLANEYSAPDISYTRPPHLAGTEDSLSTGSGASVVSDSELSIAGQINERIGKLLGYQGMVEDTVDVEAAIANIMGYEIVIKDGKRFTVYKIRIYCPNSILGTWFIHRRYSDFFQLRNNLIKSYPAIASQLSFPPKRWIGSNLEPKFLGRRLAGLQVFLASVLEIKTLKLSTAMLAFLCLDKPVVDRNSQEENRAVCDTLEETIKELREQLRKNERLQLQLEYQKKMNSEKDLQIQNLFRENQLLKEQKESLMSTFSAQNKDMPIRNTSKTENVTVESLQDFSAKFNLKCEEESDQDEGDFGARRRLLSQ